jgi:TPR repeat protein
LYLTEKVKNFSFIDKNDLIYYCNKKLTDMGYKTNLIEQGNCYYYGTGVDQSYEDAFAFYLSAYLNRNAEGAYSLSYIYENGLGVKKNLYKSIKFLSDVNRFESKAYLLVWYVFVKLCIKIFMQWIFDVKVLIALLVFIGSYFFYMRKNFLCRKKD